MATFRASHNISFSSWTRVFRLLCFAWALGIGRAAMTWESEDDKCNPTIYYQDLPMTTTTRRPLTKSSLHTLLTTTHRRVLPYTSSTEPDVWDALLDLDGNVTTDTIYLIYRDTVVPNATVLQGTTTGWNREHVWPQSRGGALTDVHHVMASDWNVNAARGNKWFGDCSNSSSSDACRRPAHAQAADRKSVV